MSPLYAFSLGLLVLTVAAAIWRGGTPERLVSGLLALNWVVTTLVPFDGVEPPWAAITMDGLVCLALAYLALFGRRRWAVWAAAFSLLLMANHFTFIRFHEIQHWAFVIGYYLWGNLSTLAVAIGALTTPRNVLSRSPDSSRTQL